MTKNYYEILGIDEDALQGEIRDAYLNLSLEWHPDKNNSPVATAKFQEISEAYKILSDIDKREEYDRERERERERERANDYPAR